MGAAPYLLATYSVYQGHQSAVAQRESFRAQEKASRVQQQKADIAAYRERVQAVRQARIQRGLTAQSAQTQGVATSSSAVGATSSIASQLGANLSFLDVTQKLSGQESIFQQQSATAQGRAAMAGFRAGLAGEVFKQKYGGWESIF